MRSLYPPLKVIKNNLFAQSENLLLRWATNDSSLSPEVMKELATDPIAQELRAELEKPSPVVTEVIENDEGPPLPLFLKELIEQRTAARHHYADLPIPSRGQILRIDQLVGPNGPFDWEFASPLAILIDKPTQTPNVWAGWLVAPDTDYATYWDLLLEPEDQPFDPLAGMIQIWNPVTVYIPSEAPVLAVLKPERLQAVHALAEEFASGTQPNEAISFLGHIAPRPTFNNFSVLTGTPLGHPDEDPRCHYRVLYHTVAEILRALLYARPHNLLTWLKDNFTSAINLLQEVWLQPAPAQKLSAWLQNQVVEATQAGWQTLEDIFGTKALSIKPAFKKSIAVERVKKIRLGKDFIVLGVKMTPSENQEIQVEVWVYNDQSELPENLKLTLLSETGEPLEDIKAGSHTDYIVQPLTGSLGERFGIQLSLGEVSIIKTNFII